MAGIGETGGRLAGRKQTLTNLAAAVLFIAVYDP
jgi:hypothetical protein